ncbi:MAG: LysR family transcriptional regulator [Gammaproteobacteria bacterium]|nr:MAG: LysR family transcriptional regulator [Gammaproteobacteria bacterium]
MEWHGLKAFLAVADAGSFSRAAKQLHLTQPAVSKRIQRLETSLATRLFDRVGRRIFLTDAGKMLEPRARELLAQLDDTERLLKNLDRRVDGQLCVATSHHIGLHRLAPVLQRFSKTHPAVQLDIEFVDSEAAHTLLRNAETELAVVTLDPEGPAELAYRPLWTDVLVFIASADHALAQPRDAPLTLTELAEAPVILPGMGTYTGRIVAQRFATAEVPLNSSMSTNYLETIGMLVGIGLGWSVLPRTMVTPPLVELEVATEPIERMLGAVINPERTLSNAAGAFLEVLDEFANQELVSQSGF